jgi:hypothetical protein
MLCFVALASAAHPGTELESVMMAYSEIVLNETAGRGLQLSRDQLANAAMNDVEKMFAKPDVWAQGWLTEFRNDPNDTFMASLFVEHCHKLFYGYKHGIENTRKI